MNRLNIVLMSVLALQLTVSAGMYYSHSPNAGDMIAKSLLMQDLQSIHRINIVDSDSQELELVLMNDKWMLPDYHQLPANQTSVRNMLNLLANTKSTWPVTTTASSHQRFKVADDDFHKKIVLTTDTDAEQIIYLGTSPGFRQLHVRRKGEDEVYALKLNNHDFPAKSPELMDRTVLQPPGPVETLRGPDYAMSKQQDSWEPQNNEGEAIQDTVNELASTLARLRVQEAEKLPADINNAYVLNVKTAQEEYRYSLFAREDRYYIHRDDYPLAFGISKTEYDKIITQNAGTLVTTNEGKEENMLSEEDKSEKSSSPGESPSRALPLNEPHNS